jgi:hypothetical protein
MATYYVSNTGSDGAAGTSDTTPWQTVSKVNGFTFASGDTILFKRGDRWKEILTIPRSSLTVGAYGAAATVDSDGYITNAPVLDGGEYVTTWSSYVSGVSDSYTKDDFAGTSGSNITGSVVEEGSGSWAMEATDTDGTLIFSSDGMARRSDTTHYSMYVAPTSPPKTDYYVTTTIKVKSLLALDLAYNVVHRNPSGQGARTYIFSALLQNAGASSLRVGTFVNGVLTDFHDVALSNFVAGQTYTLKSVKQGAILTTYIDGVLKDTYDFSSTLVGTFQTGSASVGIRMGGATATLETDTTGMQIDTFDCGPIGAPGTAVNTYQATLAADPLIVDFNGVYSFQGLGVNLLNNNEYFWKGGKIYVRSDSGQPSNTAVIAGTRDNAILGGSTTGITLQDIAIEHTRDHSIYWSSGNTATFQRVMIQKSSGGAGNNGVIALNAHNDATIDSCVVRNCGSDAIYMNTCLRFKITNNRLGQEFGEGADCLQHDIGAGNTVNGYIADNYLFGSTSPKGCIILQSGNNYTIERNYMVGGHNFHIAIFGNNTTIRNNIFYNLNASTPNTGGAIELTDNSATAITNCTIQNNVFVDTVPAIHMWSAGTATRTGLLIEGNLILNVSVTPDYQFKSSQAIGGSAKNNVFWNMTGSGYSIKHNGTSGSWTSTDNMFVPSKDGYYAHLANWDGSSYGTWSQLNTATGTEQNSRIDSTRYLLRTLDRSSAAANRRFADEIHRIVRRLVGL